MPIHKHLTDKTAFGPVAIEAMSKAFEEACIALQVYAGDEKGREIIATRIIDLARNGLIDPTALRDRIIAEARLSELEGERNDRHSAPPRTSWSGVLMAADAQLQARTCAWRCWTGQSGLTLPAKQ